MSIISSRSSNQTQNQSNSSSNYTDVARQWAALARIDYGFYVEYTHRGLYKPARHTDIIARELQKVEAGEVDRLMIFMPPRHSKSMTVTETFPSYFIGKNPERRVIEVSYGDALAKKFGRANKQKLQEYGAELFGVELARDNFSVTNWDVRGRRGGMVSVGIGSGITGQGADLLVIDDPIKNRKEADSSTYRDAIWHEWQNTLLTRLHPNGRVIIILTRWHEDDLAGRLLASEPDRWKVLSLPAIAEKEDDLIGRKIGEPLWPEHGFGHEWAAETKRAVGSRAWEALYQQRPSPAEGSLFKRNWLQFYKEAPSDFEEIIQSWDCAFKGNDDSDFVVGQVWGRKGADKYLLDQVRARMDFPATLRAVVTLSAKHPDAFTKLIEDKANGSAVIQTLKREVAGLIPINPDGGKLARAAAAAPDFEAGNIYLPHPNIAPWVHDYVEEMASFPNGSNDDQVDATTQAINRFNARPRPSIRTI